MLILEVIDKAFETEFEKKQRIQMKKLSPFVIVKSKHIRLITFYLIYKDMNIPNFNTTDWKRFALIFELVNNLRLRKRRLVFLA